MANVYKGTDGDQGVTDEFLGNLGISFENYTVPVRPGSLCTYDPEDKSYYLPENIPTEAVCESSLSANYQILASDISFGLSDDISGLSDFFTGIIPSGIGLSAIVGRNRGVVPGSVDAPDFGGQIGSGGPGGGIGGGGGGIS